MEEISRLNPDSTRENPTIMDIREMQQYGVATSLENRALEKILETAKAILDQTKEEIEA